jgi:hypothetical protein
MGLPGRRFQAHSTIGLTVGSIGRVAKLYHEVSQNTAYYRGDQIQFGLELISRDRKTGQIGLRAGAHRMPLAFQYSGFSAELTTHEDLHRYPSIAPLTKDFDLSVLDQKDRLGFVAFMVEDVPAFEIDLVDFHLRIFPGTLISPSVRAFRLRR